MKASSIRQTLGLHSISKNQNNVKTNSHGGIFTKTWASFNGTKIRTINSKGKLSAVSNLEKGNALWTLWFTDCAVQINFCQKRQLLRTHLLKFKKLSELFLLVY